MLHRIPRTRDTRLVKPLVSGKVFAFALYSFESF